MGKCIAIWVLPALAVTGALVWVLIEGPWIFDGDRLDEDLPTAAGVIITGFRTMVIALIAGLIAGLGLHYTHRNHVLAREQLAQTQQQFELAQQQFEHAQEQFAATQEKDRRADELTREGQVTGRYVEAIKLLASPHNHERLGGIYSLERIMKDSERDRTTVVEMLAAFVRNTLAEIPRSDADKPERVGAEASIEIAEDVRAAFNVLGRNWDEGSRRADLRRVHFTGIDMSEVDLSGAWLTNGKLPGVNLYRARLDWANLAGADLANAQLGSATLRFASLARARLVNVWASGVDLRNADLTGADLARARFHGADLSNANLGGADFEGASLVQSDLTGADLRNAHLLNATLKGAHFMDVDLSSTTGLAVDQICQAEIYESTQMPADLVKEPLVRSRIIKCEEALES